MEAGQQELLVSIQLMDKWHAGIAGTWDMFFRQDELISQLS
jgi:hypothetical protein